MGFLPYKSYQTTDPQEKLALEIVVRRHINKHWKGELVQEAVTKSTLKFLNNTLYGAEKVHSIWTQCKHNSSLLTAICPG